MKRKSAVAAIRRLYNLPDELSDGDDSTETFDRENETAHVEDPTSSCDDESGSDDDQPLRERLARNDPELRAIFDINESNLRGRDGTLWSEIPSGTTCGQTSLHNIMRIAPGPTSYACSRIVRGSPLSAWRVLFDETILRNIRRCTLAEASRQMNDEWDLSLHDLEKTFGLLYAKGLLMSSKTPVRLLWSEKWAPPLFSKTMTRDRFYSIMKNLRFDEKQTRSERLQQDKFALASALWTPFIENCRKCFNPYENLTIDEQLLPCKCRCRFIQYMANKPDKFGLKFFILADVKTKYVVNAIPYLGKFDDRPQDEGLGLHIVKKLSSPIENNGHNITADNFFTSLEVVRHLREKKTSYIGTIRSNRRELPDINEVMKHKPVYESQFLRSDDSVSLTLYKVKKNRTVSLLSTLHPSPSIPLPESEKRKPDVILDYNVTKCGVDCFDSMARSYTTRCTSRRWPLYVLYNVLDICGINSWILYQQVTQQNITRRDFLFELIQELTSPPHGPQSSSANEVAKKNATKRRRCSLQACDNKTSTICVKCERACCGLHTFEKITTVRCQNCAV